MSDSLSSADRDARIAAPLDVLALAREADEHRHAAQAIEDRITTMRANALAAALKENATLRRAADLAYPHMCRDGHEEVGWRGDGEMCPVCIARSVSLSENG